MLAHRTELINQTAEKIRHINPHLQVEIEQAGKKASPTSDVIVAPVQTLQGKCLKKVNPDDIRVVFVDEAHHATAKSYVRILRHLKAVLRPGHRNHADAPSPVPPTTQPDRGLPDIDLGATGIRSLRA